MMKDNSKMVLDFLKEVDGKQSVTLTKIAEATGLTPRQVNGSLVAFQRHKDEEGNIAPLIVREETEEVKKADGKNDKYIFLTDAGRAYTE